MSDDTKALKLENEHLREELHKLTLKLETVTKTHSTELEFIKEEHEIEKQDLKAKISKVHDEYKAREAIKEDRNSALTEELNSLREELDTALEQCEKYKTQVEILKNAKSAGAASSYSDYEGLKESQRILRGQLIEKEEILTANVDKIARLDREVVCLRGVVQELNEVGEGKDSAIKELSLRIKDLEREKDEETGALQNEVLMLKEEVKRLSGQLSSSNEDAKPGTGGGSSTRGNSLFSEVDERRLKVEGELTRLRELVKRLTAENRTLQMELERGDTHSATITTQLEVIAKSEEELAMEIKKDKSETLNLFDCYRDRMEYLRSEYTRKLSQYRSLQDTPPTTPGEVETLRQDRDSLQLLRISLERENNELKRELKYNKHLRTNAEANVKILKAKLDFIKTPEQHDGSKENAELDLTDVNLNPLDGFNKNESVLSPSRVTPKSRILTKHENQDKCNQQ